jgi:hypothetical protein
MSPKSTSCPTNWPGCCIPSRRTVFWYFAATNCRWCMSHRPILWMSPIHPHPFSNNFSLYVNSVIPRIRYCLRSLLARLPKSDKTVSTSCRGNFYSCGFQEFKEIPVGLAEMKQSQNCHRRLKNIMQHISFLTNHL